MSMAFTFFPYLIPILHVFSMFYSATWLHVTIRVGSKGNNYGLTDESEDQ